MMNPDGVLPWELAQHFGIGFFPPPKKNISASGSSFDMQPISVIFNQSAAFFRWFVIGLYQTFVVSQFSTLALLSPPALRPAPAISGKALPSVVDSYKRIQKYGHG